MKPRYSNEEIETILDDIILWLETGIESTRFMRSYERIRAYLLRIAASTVNAPRNRRVDCEPEEIVDGLFLHLKNKCLNGLLINKPYRPFILAALYNRSMSAIRRAKVRRTTYYPLETIRAGECSSKLMTTKEERRRVLTALRRVEFEQRTALIGQYWRGRTAQEAANRLHLSVATINRRRTEGRASLTAIMASTRQSRAA